MAGRCRSCSSAAAPASGRATTRSRSPAHSETGKCSSPGGGPSLWIKRDDCTGLAGGGNKTRKLEYLLGDALGNDADTLVTQGAPTPGPSALSAPTDPADEWISLLTADSAEELSDPGADRPEGTPWPE